MGLCSVMFLISAMFSITKATVIYKNALNPFEAYTGIGNYPISEGIKRRCPLCDSSVYSYCSDKLFHDSCCCSTTNNPYDPLPYECKFADCTFLHSNTCYEHRLITACCCTNYLRRKK